LKEELVEDNDESSPEDEEGLFVHESLEDVLFEEFDDGMFNSSSTCDLSNNPVSGVPVALLDNNPSPDFPLSGEKDLDLDSNTVISAPPDSAYKFERFALSTIVRSPPPTTMNLVSVSPPQYFAPTYDPGGPHICKPEWNLRFDTDFQKLLSALISVSSPLLDPPPEPPDVVVILLPQLSATINTPIGFLPTHLPLNNVSGYLTYCIIIANNFFSSKLIIALWKHSSIEAIFTIHAFFHTLVTCTDVFLRLCDDDFYGFGGSGSRAYEKIKFSPNTFYLFTKMPLRTIFFWNINLFEVLEMLSTLFRSSFLWPNIFFIDNVVSNCGVIDGLKLWHCSITIIGVRMMALPTSIKFLGLTFGIGALRFFIVITSTSLDMVSTLDMVYIYPHELE
jgi:hypothetical protein